MSIEIPHDTNSHFTAGASAAPAPDGDRSAGVAQAEATKARRTPRRLDWRIVCIVALAAISVPVWRLVNNNAGAHTASIETAPLQSVAVAKVVREDLFNEVKIPAEFRPYLEVELHAKVSGYVDQIRVDIGDEVKSGQLLATLEVPELRDELARTKAAERRAAADYKDAHLVYTRLLEVEKDHPNLVAQQELDAAEDRDATTEAAVGAAKAETGKYQTLIAYTRITAPFDGVITHRYADPGSLIQAGTTSDTQSKPLVRLSDNYRLRLDFPVPVAYVKEVQLHDSVEVQVESLKDKLFTGLISRFSQKVDENTRTMEAEIEVPNPSLELVPGMYATLGLKIERRPHVLTLPTEAISSEKAPSVYLVNSSQEIEQRTVTVGLETPGRVEITSGLAEGDIVIVGGRAKVRPGQKVEAKLSALAQQ